MLKTKELAELLERATKRTKQNERCDFYVVNADDGIAVAQFYTNWNKRTEEALANAEMMVAAPTLAADLIRCRELLAGMLGVFESAMPCETMEHSMEHPNGETDESCPICKAKKYLSETEG